MKTYDWGLFVVFLIVMALIFAWMFMQATS